MPSADSATLPDRAVMGARSGRRGGEVALTLAILTALFAALLPVVRVVSPGVWLLGSIVLATLVLAAGYIARRYQLPAVAVSLIEAAVWVVFMTMVFLRETALLFVIPTPETVRSLPVMVDGAMTSIVNGAAPLDETMPLSFFIVGAMGLLTIIVDHVVLTARMPLLAAVGIVAVSLIPAIAVPRAVDVSAFVFLSIAILFLLRAETRSRERPIERAAERSAGVPATALGIGAIAVVVAVVATPLLPQPGIRQAGFGPGGGIDATLELGDDLRRPQEVEVLLVRTNASTPPYLRATTLSRFDGAVWQPDRVRSIPLGSNLALGELFVDPDIRVSEYRTSVEVQNLASLWLPIPYPAVGVDGLEGEWAAVPYNRTVIAQSGSTQGQDYEVVTNLPRPTLEQIRASSSGGDGLRDETLALPEGMPASIAELAAEVTAETTNDYDALVALQRWFRGGGDFRYSLEAPVEDGFDGSGAEAVAQFLEQREGYCVHFASAFALMARSLGMPTRIVIGYLPGVATGDIVDSQPVFSVSSQQLHAWPEVYFDGIGWVPFEPTVGLGVPTSFSAASGIPGDPDNPNNPDNAPNPGPTSTAQIAPEDIVDSPGDVTSGAEGGTVNPLPTLGVILGILFVLAIPALAREVRRRQLAAAADAGDAAAAWRMVQDAAIDLAVPVPASETPRAFAARLVHEHGAPAGDMELLVAAIERASYAPRGGRDYGSVIGVTDAATAVRAALLSTAPPSRRILAIAAPRSLIVRPGSVYAGTAGVRAR